MDISQAFLRRTTSGGMHIEQKPSKTHFLREQESSFGIFCVLTPGSDFLSDQQQKIKPNRALAIGLHDGGRLGGDALIGPNKPPFAHLSALPLMRMALSFVSQASRCMIYKFRLSLGRHYDCPQGAVEHPPTSHGLVGRVLAGLDDDTQLGPCVPGPHYARPTTQGITAYCAMNFILCQQDRSGDTPAHTQMHFHLVHM